MRKFAALLLALIFMAACSVCAGEADLPADENEEAAEAAGTENAAPEGSVPEDGEIPGGITSGEWILLPLDGGDAEIARYMPAGEPKTAVEIPEMLEGMRITAIGDRAFENCARLESAVLPESVIRIGNGAFSGCAKLRSVTLPSGLTSVGANPFALCGQLTEIVLDPDHPCFEVRGGVLYGKQDGRLISYPCGSAETSFTVPDDVGVIGESAFRRCESLASVSLPEGLASIGPGAFSECTSLAGITVPEGVAEIPDRAFSGCGSLRSAVIPESVTRIGSWAFFGCFSLPEIEIPDGTAEIGIYAFSHCSALTSVTVPDGVSRIGAWAFSYCDKLAKADLPESAEEIGYNAFDYCAEDLTVFGGAGSAAEQYCRVFQIPFSVRDTGE